MGIFRKAPGLAIVLCALWPGISHAQTELVQFDLSAMPMAKALAQFAMQANLSIDDSAVDFDGKVSAPIDGEYRPQEALRMLLAGSGLTFQIVGQGSIRIRLASPVSPPDNNIEEVVVSATKRDEVAETLAQSISVITAADIQTIGATTLNDIASQTAGLIATNLGPGQDKLFVRGLTDSVLPGSSESVLGLYLDDTRIADDAPDPGLVLVDIERVEVLRGPQGSLYGAGSLDGLIRIVSNKPNLDSFDATAGATASLTADGGFSQSLEATVNAPLLSDEVALRVVGYEQRLSGFVDDPVLNTTNTNKTDVAGARAALAWQPNGTWVFNANFAAQDIESEDSQYYIQSLGPENRNNLLPEPHSDRILIGALSANADLGWADLVSNFSYVKRDLTSQFDASQAWPLLTGFPFGASAFGYARDIQSISHETRLVSAGSGPWQWLAGVFLSGRDESLNTNLTGPDGTGTATDARSEQRRDRANEAALFGELTYAFWSNFAVTAGLRAFTASHNVSATSTGMLANVPPEFSGANHQRGLAPKFVLSYRPDHDATFYAQYSEGYRLGGLNADGPVGATGERSSTFDSDILRNYETGAKLRVLNGLATINADIYYDVWRDVQSDEIAPDGAFYVLNAGTVRDLGAELEIAAEPVPNLSIKANAFWNNATLSPSIILRAGAEPGLPGAPNATVGLTGRYDIPVGINDLFAVGEYSYVGPSHLGFGEGTPGMGNYQLINLRVGILRDNWSIALFIDNVTNELHNTFAFGNPFLPGSDRQITAPRPRTVGIELLRSDL